MKVKAVCRDIWENVFALAWSRCIFMFYNVFWTLFVSFSNKRRLNLSSEVFDMWHKAFPCSVIRSFSWVSAVVISKVREEWLWMEGHLFKPFTLLEWSCLRKWITNWCCSYCPGLGLYHPSTVVELFSGFECYRIVPDLNDWCQIFIDLIS